MAAARGEDVQTFARHVLAMTSSHRRQWLHDFYSAQDGDLATLLCPHLLQREPDTTPKQSSVRDKPTSGSKRKLFNSSRVTRSRKGRGDQTTMKTAPLGHSQNLDDQTQITTDHYECGPSTSVIKTRDHSLSPTLDHFSPPLSTTSPSQVRITNASSPMETGVPPSPASPRQERSALQIIDDLFFSDP